ncbi:MAG: Coq4 family protein [Pseudomonadota bacterium]
MARRLASFADHIPPDELETVDGFPVLPIPPIKPLHALAAVFKLVANKEDTRQVFEITAALSGRSARRMFTRFVRTDYGRRVVAEPIKLEEILGDRERLRVLPEGSLGRVYLDFMEGEDLTPDGIINAAEEAGLDYRSPTQFEEMRRMFLHAEVHHDLWHVLTGYGRDALGELCNLGFTRAQSGNDSFRLITWIGALAIKLERPGLPVWKAIRQGYDIGRNAEWLMGQDVEALLALPLDEVRRKLNFSAPTIYNSVPVEVKEGLLKPRVKQTQSERERETGRAAPAAP